MWQTPSKKLTKLKKNNILHDVHFGFMETISPSDALPLLPNIYIKTSITARLLRNFRHAKPRVFDTVH